MTELQTGVQVNLVTLGLDVATEGNVLGTLITVNLAVGGLDLD